MKKRVLAVCAAFTVFCAAVYGQGSNSNWMPPPLPLWFRTLSDLEREALIEMATRNSFTCFVVPPSFVKLKTREIIKQYGMAWAYDGVNPDNGFATIVRDPVVGQYYVFTKIYRSWLNSIR